MGGTRRARRALAAVLLLAALAALAGRAGLRVARLEDGAAVLAPAGLVPAVAPRSRAMPQDAQPVRVALYRGVGASARSWKNVLTVLKCFPRDVEVSLVRNASREQLRREEVDVLVVAGGVAQVIATWHRRHGHNLRVSARRLVAAGGGFVGICAGAYLGTAPAFGLSPFTVRRGMLGFGSLTGDLAGEPLFYANGPLFAVAPEPAEPPARDPEVVLRSSAASRLRRKGEAPLRVGGLALVVANRFGDGHVVLSGVHPETVPGTKAAPACDSLRAAMMRDLVLRAAGRAV